jgi:hypothetical protein
VPKFAVFQACAARAAGHCSEHAGKLPDLQPACDRLLALIMKNDEEGQEADDGLKVVN